ncbi:MAG: ACT domain-containing protein [Anaerolineales bacterium]|uniref:ACT domain-containing protein n=1 Tax=Candidatus Desulfolinea nitratireducens TaxID=2841698 RepID=A0A8J6NMS9_9CHLR|nr:ACT domain-containing protein [Candidatus Desulfolinea nitratireducens]MBL6961496.1 ACT domain-containing protein [Anaerolineales bacterium]
MAMDLTVILQDRPGTLADVGEALGKAGINIDGLCGSPCEGKGVLHIAVEDGEGAKAALEAVGQTVQELRDVLVIDIDDKPGEFGRICRQIADAGVNVNLSYVATRTRMVLGADDLDKARAALG